MISPSFRIGQIVPSSNTTMETEIPAMLRAREAVLPERFTFHSSRMRMKTVTREELACMDGDSDRCALELSDARVDVLGYACLVAIMSMGQGYHLTSQKRLHRVTTENGAPAPVVTSAGALVDGLKIMGAKKIVLIAPYMLPLTRMVVDYIESTDVTVQDFRALEVADNIAVGRLDPGNLPEIAASLDTRSVDAIVLSACVQMPSLSAIPMVEAQSSLPVLSAAAATSFAMLSALNLRTEIPDAGYLLSGQF